jgi:hypothetical protein
MASLARRSLLPAMSRETALLWAFFAGLLLCGMLYGALALLRDDGADRPYLKILGSSFILNYRVSDTYMGFSAAVDRPIPIGTVLQARFEDPLGGPPHLVEERIGVPDRRISLRSPSLSGVIAGKPYGVDLLLLDRETREPFWEHRFTVTSEIDGSVVSDAPLTIGPGYQRPVTAR